MKLMKTMSLGLLPFALAACAVTSVPASPSPLGTAASAAALGALIDEPGPVTVETVASVDWSVPLSGLLNVDHPRARAEGLGEREEPIQVFFHVLRHPTKGDFLVDTGVERAFRDDPDHTFASALVASQMGLEKMKFRALTGDWLAAHPDVRPKGVFLTHLHLDHVSGLRDVPKEAPVYVGAGEVEAKGFLNLFVQGSTDRALGGRTLVAWSFAPDPSGQFAGAVDVFGDGSVLALHVPGHTVGSTAYLVRTPNGPVLLTGDACHTRWGWANEVEPGSFSDDQAKSRESLLALRRLQKDHPKLDVRLGHQ